MNVGFQKSEWRGVGFGLGPLAFGLGPWALGLGAWGLGLWPSNLTMVL